jgi:hypothetical protein
MNDKDLYVHNIGASVAWLHKAVHCLPEGVAVIVRKIIGGASVELREVSRPNLSTIKNI